ncbi:DnaJ domain containing protein [Nitzschia inconspicua]|uniref:DnaJ domain containing protein n=1 Tax=Nitzschia inconspicua TaxID=303405 RepID=A0A9K3M1Q8_9STRA|nr:DnaJ domain containing protein [Nitzschia inconspicua]
MNTDALNCFGDSRANLTPFLRTKSRTQLASSSSTDTEIAAFDDTSTDPFVILGLDAPTADAKVIKRAYKRRALKFHPDVVTTQESTAAEKKAASDRFAKINWAYQTLSGKREANDKTYGGTTATTGTSTSSTGGWSPPHRRSGGYTTSSDSSWPGSTDWRDFMPKYEDDKEYDAGGDSFGKIFSDLFAGAAYGAAGVAGSSAGLLMDFIEFLEGNVDGYGADSGGFGSRGSDDYDAELQVLLRTGSLDDVANEMDDTNLVVEQLQSKARSIDDEILTVNAEAKMESRYMEKIELEERVAELKARKGVIDGYLKKSRKRLLSLQTRYKELISYGGANDSYAGGGRRSSSSSSSTSGGSSTTSERTGTTSSSPYDSSTRFTNDTGDQNDSWKTEGFGSSTSPRGSRGSARRRARRSSSTTDAGTTQSSSSSTGTATPSSPPSPPRSESPYSSSSSPSYVRESVRPTSNPSTSTVNNSTSISSDSSVPPHRRTSSTYTSSAEENRRRMREIKVDEEFEKLKKDLGL